MPGRSRPTDGTSSDITTGLRYLLELVFSRMLADSRLFPLVGDPCAEASHLPSITGYLPHAQKMSDAGVKPTPPRDTCSLRVRGPTPSPCFLTSFWDTRSSYLARPHRLLGFKGCETFHRGDGPDGYRRSRFDRKTDLGGARRSAIRAFRNRRRETDARSDGVHQRPGRALERLRATCCFIGRSQ